RALLSETASPLRISIVIPTLNEAGQIAEVIEQTRALGDCEILVVDGGSTDNTLEKAQAADAVIASKPGRAVQQNTGAKTSRGEVLLFLHADCRLQPGSFEAIQTALQDPRCVGGCFRQRIEAPGWKYRLMERGNGLRVRLLKWAYGDQGIFVRRSCFEELGGFPELRLMEDLYFMKRLKRKGQFALIDPPIHISARRWQKKGILRQTLRNWTLITMAHCGISPDRLARFYPHVR
ncbi:MAG: TIGR04283 family arsenosugar biosynthesis glycosyltransferase, partial [Planctomycetaceae bacterium]|nr:TIGR04283 family arsenosugar biosynthesis glycosyltransferase [Planctomycetaceae bacterium]